METVLTTVDDDGVVYKTFQAFFKTPYNHDRMAESDRTGLSCPEPTLAQQHQKDEADINTIVRNFGITGKLPLVPLPPMSGDFDEVFDFQSAMNLIAAAKASFMALPADVRDAFHNDPTRFVDTVESMTNDTNKENKARNMAVLKAMGLAVDAPAPADRTTLGDVLAAIKAQGAKGDSPAPKPPENGA